MDPIPSPSEPSNDPPEFPLTWDEFTRVDMRVGRIVSAEPLQNARRPAYVLSIDFGPLGVKRSSAQLTRRYTPETLVGRSVVAVVNFPRKQIGTVMSEVLVLGAVGDGNDVILLSPDSDHDVPLGTRIG